MITLRTLYIDITNVGFQKGTIYLHKKYRNFYIYFSERYISLKVLNQYLNKYIHLLSVNLRVGAVSSRPVNLITVKFPKRFIFL